ncbi:endosialidase catalytic beta-propeller domain-containing protein [Escherichia coli]
MCIRDSTDTPWYNAWTQDKTFVYDMSLIHI